MGHLRVSVRLIAAMVMVMAGLRRWARRPRGWRLGGGDAHQGVLFARVVGSGPPSIVLLHGVGGSNRYWAAEFDALGGPDGSVVVPDLLGFGRSPRQSEVYDLDAHARSVEMLLDELGAREPVVLAAHSFGAVVALRLAGRRPDLIGSVLAFGPPWYADAAGARASLARMGPMARLFALDERWSHAVCAWSCAHRRLAAALSVVTRIDLPSAVAADGVQHSWASYHGTLEALIDTSSVSLLATVTQPVHVVTGDDDLIPDASLLNDLQVAGRIASLATWPGGHDLPLVHRSQAVALMSELRESGRVQR